MSATIHTMTFGATQDQVQQILDAGYSFDASGEARPDQGPMTEADLRWLRLLQHAMDDNNGPHAA